MRRIFASVAVTSLVAAGITVIPTQSEVMAATSGSYATWTLNGSTGSMVLPDIDDPAAFASTGSNLSLSSGSTVWLSETTPFGAAFGSSRDNPYLIAGISSGAQSSIVTYTFDTATPAGTWGFALGDIDADAVTVTATDDQGNAVDVSSWFEGVFNYCGATGTRPATCSGEAGTDVPTWDASTATLTGSGADTKGASGWFRPRQAIRTLTFEFVALSGFPNYQTWFATEAATPPQSGYYVSVVARACPTYSDIMANRARNNIMESLEDVGVDSIYPGLGDPQVSPAVENLPETGQGACEPLEDWTFEFGSGLGWYDFGDFGRLSLVFAPNGNVTTKAVTPELDSLGNPTGRSIEGAATMELSQEQFDILQRDGSLTAQGGTNDAAMNNRTDLAFGTLRCAVDNYNADNVEYVVFPTNTKHVYCYAYYVATEPASGQITITKEVDGEADGVSFGFGGNLSFNEGGGFNLAKDGSETFYRQAGQTWTVTEGDAAPYRLSDISCTGGDNVTIDVPNKIASITLGAGENVDCTFTNTLAPAGQLQVYKVSDNDVGTFTGTLTGPGDYTQGWQVTTTVDGRPELILTDDELNTGTYTLTEDSAPGWDASIRCTDGDGDVVASSQTNTVDLPVAEGVELSCIIRNVQPAKGSVTVTSTIIGGTGSPNVESTYRVKSNTTVLINEAVTIDNTAWATPETKKLPTEFPLGPYRLTGKPPLDTATNTWSVDSVTCSDGVVISGTNAEFSLTGTSPDVTCAFVYRAEPINPVVSVSKTVVSGAEQRTEPVILEIRCLTDAEPFVASVELPVGPSTIAENVTVPVTATSCTVVETQTGAPPVVEPGEISVALDGVEWPEGQRRSVRNGETVLLAAESSTGAQITQVVQGDCIDRDGSITPVKRDSSCVIEITATGGAVETETAWVSPNSSGSGATTNSFPVAPGGEYVVSFENSYTGETETATTSRVMDTVTNPATLSVTKEVLAGNGLRTGNVVVEITCDASAAADPTGWPKRLRLARDVQERGLKVTVPGDEMNRDTCRIVETSSGINQRSAGSISPQWDSRPWRASKVRTLPIGQRVPISASSSTGSAVETSVEGPCRIREGRISAREPDAQCTVTFTAEGRPGRGVVTAYPLGQVATTTAGAARTLSVTNAYSRQARTITQVRQVRTVELPPCPLTVDAARSVSASGTTTVIRDMSSGDGCAIVQVKTWCSVSGVATRGDFRNCTFRREGDRVLVTTYGRSNVRINVRIVATGPDHEKAVWRKSYRVR